jgi:phosphoglycolate phosphatase-like HAD superfamily hydrolase
VERNAADIRAVACPAVSELLQELQSARKLLGIVTGNLEPIGWAKLEAAGVRHYFDFGFFSASLPSAGRPGGGLRFDRRVDILRAALAEVHRRLGEAASSCVVGDTPADVIAARELSIPIVAVATGTYSREQLQAEGPDVCIGGCDELLEKQ